MKAPTRRYTPDGRDRRGKILVLFATLSPVLIGGMAVSIDTGIITTSRAQLQAMSDSAALAGAIKLATENRVRGATSLTTEMNDATTTAKSYATANRVLGTAGVLNDPAADGSGGDITIGYLDPATSPSFQGSLSTASSKTSLFNSVQVAGTRDGTHGGLVPTPFASIYGYRGTSVSVTSTASVAPYSIAGYQSTNNLSAQLLPIVLEKTTYDLMLGRNGVSNPNGWYPSDNYTYNPTTKTVTSGADGIKESNLYPVQSGNPGNWGTVKIGVSNNSTSTLGAQIRYGITQAQLNTFPGGVVQLDTTLTPPSMILGGNPGISAGIKDDLISIIGKPVAIPIYDQTGGNGNNAWYRIIEFAPVRILDVNFQGNPKYVIIQSALVTDPTAIAGTARGSWTSGGLIKVTLTR